MKLRGETDFLASLLTGKLLFLNKPWFFMTTVEIKEQYLLHGCKTKDRFLLSYFRRRFTKN